MADGSIEFNVDLDAKNAEKELAKLKVSILKLEAELHTQQRRKTALEAEMEAAGQAADRANERLQDLLRERDRLKRLTIDDADYADRARLPALDAQIKEQETMVKGLEKDFNAAADAVDKINQKITKTTDELKTVESLAGELTLQAAEIERSQEEVEDASSVFEKRANRLIARISGLVKRVFFFSLITMGLRELRTGLLNVIKSNDAAAAALGRLKGAMLTMVQPVLEVAIPAFVTLVNVLTQAVTAVAALFAQLSGKTLAQSAAAAKSLYGEQAALSGVGSAAKKAGRSLAAFDEINKLANSDGGASVPSAPDFDLSAPDGATLQKILALAETIGATLAGWKLGRALGLGLEQTIGLIGGILGAALFVQSVFDIWSNGISFGGLAASLVGLAGVAVGLGSALGPVAAGIALIVGGLALLTTGIHDAMENGMVWANTLTMIAGLLAAGLGIGVLTGHWLPLLLDTLAGALLALVMFTGHGGELMDGLRDVFEGFAQFVSGLMAGDLDQAIEGLEKTWKGLGEVWDTVIQSMKDAWEKFVKWVTEETDGELTPAVRVLEGLVSGAAERIKTILARLADWIAQTLGQELRIVYDLLTGRWKEAAANVLIGVMNALAARLENFLNVVPNRINGILKQVNSAIKALNKLPGNNIPTVSFSAPTISLPRIPALAAGAVIPPNREFLAVLGDQNSGNNIEAPEALLRQMVQAAAGANTALLREILQAVKDGKVIMVDRTVLGKTAQGAMYDLARMGY